MKPFLMSEKMARVHSDIRGPIYVEALRMQAEGTPILKLNTGNPGSFGFTMPESIRKALLQGAERAVPYCDFRGMEEARQAILDYHRSRGIENVGMDNIFIGNGVSEVVTMATAVVLHQGDEILIPSPSYSLWTNCAYLAGAEPIFYRCDEESEWYPDVDDIASKITDKTKAIVLINPNNPTGAVYPDEITEKIVKLAKKHNLLIFSDEIYDRLVMDGRSFTSVAAIARNDCVVMTFNGLSKSHCLCGFRCGWVLISGKPACYDEIMQGMVKYASMRLCGNALTQLVIPAALNDSDSTKQMITPGGRLYEQREAAIKALSRYETLSVVKNSAAFYIFPKINTKLCRITDDKKFAMDLLKSKHVLIVPGSGFDYHESPHFRVVMLPKAQTLYKAMCDIGDFLADYSQD